MNDGKNFAIHRSNGETWIRLERWDGSTYAWTVIDTADWNVLKHYRWSCLGAKSNRTLYAVTNQKGKLSLLHRLLEGRAGLEVDHIDGLGLNNRRANLRACTRAENRANQQRPVNNVSGFKGVFRDKRQRVWIAQIQHKRKVRKLGSFNSKEEAALAYDRAARELFGEFARLNIPDA